MFPVTPAFNQEMLKNHQVEKHNEDHNAACCQVCYLEQTGGLAKMCPSIEGSLRELVLQIAAEENFNPSSSFINNQVGDATTSNAGAGGAVNQSNSLFGMTTQLKLGTRLSEM